jgi:hypothetical protein
MNKKWICSSVVALILVSLISTIRSVESQNKPWIGKWDILWGLPQMSMMDKVEFIEDNGTLNGETQWGSGFIIGWVGGQLFQGTWAREPSYTYPDHGDIQLTISSNGNQFSGRWRMGNEEDRSSGKEVGEWFPVSGKKEGTDNLKDPPPAKPKKDFIVIVLQINNPRMRVDERVVEIDPGRSTYPIIIKGSTLCPIRAIIEALGGDIAWNGSEQKATLTLKNLKLELWINKKTAKVNGKIKNLSVAPQIINGRTMLPVRFVSEELGCKVDWDSIYQLITIEYSLKEKPPEGEKPPGDPAKCIISIKINESTRISTKDEEDKSKKERWSFKLEALVQNAPDDVILAYEWKYGDGGTWGDRSKDPNVIAIIVFPVNMSPFVQEEQPVAVRVWDWTNGTILATYSGTVARPIKII